MPYYAVKAGRTTGILLTWEDCRKSIYKFKNPIYKKFDDIKLAEAFITSSIVEENGDSVESDESDTIFVYTDGACINNGKYNAVAGYGIYFGQNDERNVSQRVPKDYKQTNNVGELLAIIMTLAILETDINNKKNIVVCTDSNYCILCATSYGKKQDIIGWKKDIPNKDLVRTLFEFCKEHPNIKFKHINAHTNATDKHSLGNAEADKLANNVCL